MLRFHRIPCHLRVSLIDSSDVLEEIILKEHFTSSGGWMKVTPTLNVLLDYVFSHRFLGSVVPHADNDDYDVFREGRAGNTSGVQCVFVPWYLSVWLVKINWEREREKRPVVVKGSTDARRISTIHFSCQLSAFSVLRHSESCFLPDLSCEPRLSSSICRCLE